MKLPLSIYLRSIPLPGVACLRGDPLRQDAGPVVVSACSWAAHMGVSASGLVSHTLLCVQPAPITAVISWHLSDLPN